MGAPGNKGGGKAKSANVRTTVPGAGSTRNSNDPKRSFVPMFKDIMQGSIYEEVDPTGCVPIANTRQFSTSGVRRLKAHIVGKTKGDESFGLGCLVEGTSTAIVVEITGTLRPLLKDYFMKNGYSDEQSASRIKSRLKWYGIIDGAHLHAAILEVMQENPNEWDGFRWRVTLLKGGFPIERYRQLARVQNERQDERFHIQVTLYDSLSGLRQEYDRLCRENNGKKPTSTEVAVVYNGMPNATDNTIRQAAGTAARIPKSVIEALGDIMSSERPDLCMSVPSRNTIGKRHADNVQDRVDCRVFRKFVSLSCIKSCTVFMNAKGIDGEKAQIHALYRVKRIYEATGFRSISSTVLSTQFKTAMGAIVEEQKFVTFLDGENWPTEMDKSRENLLQSQSFDNDIVENKGNDTDILASLLQRYRQLFPDMAAMKEAKYYANNREEPVPVPANKIVGDEAVQPISAGEGTDGTAAQRQEPDTDASPENPPIKDNSDDEQRGLPGDHKTDADEDVEAPVSSDADYVDPLGVAGGVPVKMNRTVGDAGGECGKSKGVEKSSETDLEAPMEPERDVKADAECKLTKLGIHTYQTTWQNFKQNIWDLNTKVDGILVDPPFGTTRGSSNGGKGFDDEVSEEEMKDFAGFCKNAIVTGGYIFIFTSWHFFPKWHAALVQQNISVMEYPYSLGKDPNQMQKRAVSEFPQCNAEWGLLARAPGLHPTGFKPDFNGPFHLVNCLLPRRYSAIYNVPVSKTKLTLPNSKSPIRTSEKSVQLITELLDLFMPENGVVLDAYAGTMTTAIACMQSKRSCYCMEKDPLCYREAQARLRLQVEAVEMYEGEEPRSSADSVPETDVSVGQDNSKGETTTTRADTENDKRTRTEPQDDGGTGSAGSKTSGSKTLAPQTAGSKRAGARNEPSRRSKRLKHGGW